MPFVEAMVSQFHAVGCCLFKRMFVPLVIDQEPTKVSECAIHIDISLLQY